MRRGLLTGRMSLWLLVACMSVAAAPECWAQGSSVPSGLIAYSPPGSHDIYLMGADGKQQRLLAHLPGFRGGLAWHPKGDRLAVVDQTEIVVLGLDAKVIRRISLPQDAIPQGSPAWSPDGRYLALGSTGKRGGIWLMPADGVRRRMARYRLTSRMGWFPSFSPDGKWIAFYEGNFEKGSVYRMRVDGSGRRPVARNASFPSWSPVASEIAYVDRGSIWVTKPDGTGKHVLIPSLDRAPDKIGLGWLKWPSWSPDGRWLCYRGEHPKTALYIARRDGSSRRLLVETGGLGVWQPTPKAVRPNPAR